MVGGWSVGRQLDKTPKNRTTATKTAPPPPKIKISFLFGDVASYRYITQTVYITKMLYLHMEYTISLQNRLRVGFLVGFSYYESDENFEYGEVILYLGLLSLHIKYTRL